MQGPILQLALDILNLDRAIEIAKEAQASVDWIEAGTPLIKSEGMNAIRELKRTFPGHTIVADMKTMDTGSFETEMAAKAGADVVCILGAADNETIAEAARSAKKYGAKILVDLINASDPAKRAAEVEKLGADYVGIHIGIDQQMRGKTGVDIIKSVANAVKIPVSVAGGMNSELAAGAVKAGATIVVVGGAITKAPHCAKAAESIRDAMQSKKAISSELYKKYSGENIIEAFQKVSTCNISDAMHRKGAMVGIRPVVQGAKFVGRAITVRTADGDWAKPVEAIDQAKKGEVLVIDACAGKTAIWGELATWSA
ncbi:MAG: orotidine 5'-phosphate decarboxylase, partial [Candidatus Thermoplasmatota archaeon]|nr:orotidine 5'-phosphate decarboxylase [Candidatus Thermoplasmatota archaeon]